MSENGGRMPKKFFIFLWCCFFAHAWDTMLVNGYRQPVNIEFVDGAQKILSFQNAQGLSVTSLVLETGGTDKTNKGITRPIAHNLFLRVTPLDALNNNAPVENKRADFAWTLDGKVVVKIEEPTKKHPRIRVIFNEAREK